MALGDIFDDGDHRTVRFVRTLGATPDEVWAALTEPEQLAAWLAATTVVPGPGGRIDVDFGDTVEGGPITRWEPPRVLAFEWRYPGEPDSHVTWTLTPAPDGRGTTLTLEHRRLTPRGAPGYGAGWHEHLGRLEAHLGGIPFTGPMFEELAPLYGYA